MRDDAALEKAAWANADIDTLPRISLAADWPVGVAMARALRKSNCFVANDEALSAVMSAPALMIWWPTSLWSAFWVSVFATAATTLIVASLISAM
jgi:hypothetical protein